MKIEELSVLLKKHHIDVDVFGRGQAKTLEHLLEEINAGEAKLEEREGGIVRVLYVVNVDVFHCEGSHLWRLVEDRQEFSDGRERRRQLPTAVSEKKMVDESLDRAVIRALKEELGIIKFQLFLDDPETKVEGSESPSFPGLVSEYHIDRRRVVIDPDEYHPEGYVEKQKDKSTFFIWVKEDKNCFK